MTKQTLEREITVGDYIVAKTALTEMQGEYITDITAGLKRLREDISRM